MGKKLLREIAPYKKLYRDDITGIAWVEDGSSGCAISIHPNIDDSGSVKGMKNLGYWDKADRTVRSHGFIYNIDHSFIPTEKGSWYDMKRIVADECRCQACLERRSIKEI